MARVNIDILGSSELRWSRMAEFNSDDHYIYYCGQESLRKKWIGPHSKKKKKKSKMQYLGAIPKTTE